MEALATTYFTSKACSRGEGRDSGDGQVVEATTEGDDGAMKETRARELIVKRSVGMCERCGGNGAEYSHRRSRGVRDPHAWCPCNGVRLCRTCHAWAHRHPRAARREGIHVSRYVAEPASVPVRFVNGWWYLSCDGGAQYLGARTLDFGTDRE